VKYHITTCYNVISHTNFFCNRSKNSSETSTPTNESDAFDTEVTKSHKFGLLGLNIDFKGLLLGMSLRVLAEGNRSNPR
jgi:hypothetical protein